MAKSFLTQKFGYANLRTDLGKTTNLTTEDDDKSEGEKEYDALNDETFGLDTTGGDLDDWEEGHEHFAQYEEPCGNGSLNHETNADKSLQETLKKNDTQPKNEPYNNYGEGDYDDANNIENTLNQLVLDDEVEDPAIVGIISKPLPTYRLNENRSFNISPPPPAIVESDHVGSPSTTSIWSASKGETSKVFGGNIFVPFRNTSPMYFDLKHVDSPVVKPSGVNSSFSSHCSSVTKLMSNVKTLEEIEKELLNSQKTAAAVEESSKEILMKQGVLTVGELENNISAGKTKSPHKKPIGPPPGFGNKASYARTPFNPLSPCIVTPSIGIPGARLAGSPSHMPKSMSPTSPLVCNTKPSPLVRPIHLQPLRPNVIIPPQLPHPAAFRAGHFIGQYAAGRPLMLGQVPYPSPYNTLPLVLGFQDKRDAMANFNMRSANVHQFNQRVNVKGGYGHNGWNHSREESYLNSVSEYDEYANLMSKKEKEWLINIQIIQLQSDNPYLDDYYYTNFMLKKRVKETKEKEPTLVIPERSKVVETKTYKPVQYEGSLGKLQAGSVTCPRKMIDVHSVHTDDAENDPQKLANRETKKLRQLLLDIEKLYVCVLQADDIDKRVVVLPEEARLPLYENKKEVIGKLYNGFIQNGGHFFVHMVGVRKGRNLVARSISLFSEEQLKVLLAIIFSNFAVMLKKDTTEQMGSAIFEKVKKFLSISNLETLLLFAEKLCNEFEESSGKSQCRIAVEHKVGIAFVCNMVSRAEEIYVQNPPTNAVLRRHWEEVMSSVIGCLESASLPVGIKYIPKRTFIDHLHRFSARNTAIKLISEWINSQKASFEKIVI